MGIRSIYVGCWDWFTGTNTNKTEMPGIFSRPHFIVLQTSKAGQSTQSSATAWPAIPTMQRPDSPAIQLHSPVNIAPCSYRHCFYDGHCRPPPAQNGHSRRPHMYSTSRTYEVHMCGVWCTALAGDSTGCLVSPKTTQMLCIMSSACKCVTVLAMRKKVML